MFHVAYILVMFECRVDRAKNRIKRRAKNRIKGRAKNRTGGQEK